VGKSYWAKWAVLRSHRLRWVILDTKHDPEWDSWYIQSPLPSARQLGELWREHERVVVRPAPAENIDGVLDIWLEMLHENFNRFGIVIDETYQVAFGPRAGPGFTGLVTRGRVRGQTVIMGAQRPAWVPKFVMTEANGYAIFALNVMTDRQVVAGMVGDRWKRQVLGRLTPRRWLWYDVASDRLVSMNPVAIWDVPVCEPEPSGLVAA
jgi:hypothetical protein